MTTYRKVVFANGELYHVYNRGVERRPVFTNKREYGRAFDTLKFYRFSDLPLRLSKFLVIPESERLELITNISKHDKIVEIIAYCLMPNHFHFLLKQTQTNGISRFLANFTNSYTKYFNTKRNRVGPLFQGLFKAVHIETDEQFIHVSRYIHLNPVSSFIIKIEELENYQWSSFPEYMNKTSEVICYTKPILDYFSSVEKYRQFVFDQASYAQELDKIKHLIFDESIHVPS